MPLTNCGKNGAAVCGLAGESGGEPPQSRRFAPDDNRAANAQRLNCGGFSPALPGEHLSNAAKAVP